MELILLSGIGTFVVLAAQLLDYLREMLRGPFIGHLTPSTAEEPPHVPVSPSTDVAMRYDQAA
jgi:hypothetical protein